MHSQLRSALFAGLVLSAPAMAQTAADPAAEALDLAGGATIAAEFARIEVPENRSVDGSRAISLAVLRVRSPSAEPGLPVFLLAGGPGGSSIELLKFMLRGGGRPFLELMGGDLVAIDQRGVGRSEPNLESSTSFGFAVEVPGERDAMLERIREVSREEAARWRGRGVDLAGYTTAESADDIDAVRRAFGYDQIALFGISYGSHLAMATIRRHEAHVGRAVLIVPEGPDHTIKLPSQTQQGLEHLAELVARHPSLGTEIPDLVGMVGKLLADLENEPVFVDVEGARVGISCFDVQRTLANEIGLVRGHLERVPALVKQMADGDFSTIARELMESRRSDGVGSAMQMVMDSASGLSPARAARIAKEAPAGLLGDAVNFPFPDVADAWGAPDLGEEFRAPLHSDVPVLLLAGDLDSRTPIANAEELMEHLPNAQLIVVENAGHDLNWLQRELRDAWSAFLAGRKVECTRVTAPAPRFAPLPDDR